MNILIANDDGIYAEGVRALVEVVSSFADVTVVCPDEERSGYGHSITTTVPIRARRVKHFGDNIKAYSVNGTPADCVKLALEQLMVNPPDIVITGMNHGANVGQDQFYSGTMAAAREAVLHGIPAIATSAARDLNQQIDFQIIQGRVKETLLRLIQANIPEHIVFNVNFPYQIGEDYLGVVVAPMETQHGRFAYRKYESPKGQTCYWLENQLHDMEKVGKADYTFLNKGYTVISPLEISPVNTELIDLVQQWFQ